VPVFLGFLIGVAVTIAGAYAYDSSTGRAANGLSVANQSPMVNWDVVSNDWRTFKANVRITTEDIEQKFKQHG
jgi:hypothetical protein